jgi:hypothetical protein
MDGSVLAIDPGETTGLAWCPLLLAVDGESPLKGKGVADPEYAAQFEWGLVAGTVEEQSWKIGMGVTRLHSRILVVESSDHFLLVGGKSLKKSSLVPIKLDGAISAIQSIMNHREGQKENWFGVTVVRQTPSQAKGVVTDDVLKALGFPMADLRGENRHSKDALRHLVLFLRRMYAGRGGFRQEILDDVL